VPHLLDDVHQAACALVLVELELVNDFQPRGS
jgi:hypothetical protein